jgi:penicillin-binding protein 2
MTDRVHARLLILAVLVMSLVGTLAARAFSLQVVAADEARAAAEDNRVRELVIPAARGMVLDQQGRPLAANRISLDVSVDRRELRRLDEDGAAVLGRLADLLDLDDALLAARLQNCGTPGAQKQPNCWNGAPGADPVVARDVGIDAAGQVMADPTGFPAVAIDRVPVRQYPGRTLAAHTLGHVGAVTADDVAADPELEGAPARGQAGLELVHDEALRGQPGLERVTVDSAGHRASAGVEIPAVPGRTLVTNIDAELQAVVEEQLEAAITRARGRTERLTGELYKADGGAAVEAGESGSAARRVRAAQHV